MPPHEPPIDDDSLETLLANGRLSGAQRDRILERILDEHARKRPGWRTWATAAGAALPLAALVALLLRPDSRGGEKDGSWVAPKGEARGPLVEASCPGRPAGHCHPGDRLLFSVDGAIKGGFFAGFAECEGRERIWYFPTVNGDLPFLPARTGHSVVNQAARIGDEHGIGACKLHLFVLEARESKERLLSGAVRAEASAVIPITVGR
jgi:hypothetical protein